MAPALVWPLAFVLLGVGLFELWWLSPAQHESQHYSPMRTVNNLLFPGLSPQARKIAPIAALAMGLGVYLTFRNFTGDRASMVCGVLAALIGPRLISSVLNKGTEGAPSARAIVEVVEIAAASGYTINDAMQSLANGDGEPSEIARDVLIDVGHHVSAATALRQAGERRHPIVRRTLRLLAVYVGRGHWGPEAVESLHQIGDTIEKQRRLAESIRLATSEVRSLRLAIMIVIPAMASMLFLNNRAMMLPYIATGVGQIAMLICVVLYTLTIVLSRWLIPDWGDN